MEGFVATALFLGILAYKIVPPILAAAEAGRAAKADREFLHANPEAWKAKEQVKLERERLEAQKKFAAEESRRENAGTVAKIVRIFTS